MNQHEHIDELIAKHLAKETSAAEKDFINKWIASSETNNSYYSEMKMIYEIADKQTLQDKINIDIAWNKFSEKLPEPANKRTIFKKLIATLYGKAALFICLFGLGYLIYSQFGYHEKEIVFSSSTSASRNDTLSDKTFVSLYPNSSIRYSSSFNISNRNLKLTGEAYFKVQHNAELPFIINTGKVFIKDIGTAFTVKALPSDSTVMVTVTEGKVIFYSSQNSGMTLLKNETGIYNLISETFRKKDDSFNAETTQTLSFESTSLQLVIDTLNKVYHEHIVLSCKNLESLELTASFKEKTATPIVETIAETFGLSITRNNGTVLLNSRTCKK